MSGNCGILYPAGQWSPDKTGADFFFFLKPIYVPILSVKLLIQNFSHLLWQLRKCRVLNCIWKQTCVLVCAVAAWGEWMRSMHFLNLILVMIFCLSYIRNFFSCKLKIICLIWHIFKFIHNLGCLLCSYCQHSSIWNKHSWLPLKYFIKHF